MKTAPRSFRVFRGTDGLEAAFGPSVVAFGKFDGVHLGHRALLDRAAAAGRRLGLPHGAVTFERHPHAHLRGGHVPPMLTGLGDKLRLLCEAGAQFVVLFPTDATVLGLSAEDFARDVLRDRMGVRLVVVGDNFRFGRGGSGGIVTLRRLVSITGMDGVEIGMISVGGEVASATRIREHLARGDVARAAELLGRPFEVLGRLDDGRSTASVQWYPRHVQSRLPVGIAARSRRPVRPKAAVTRLSLFVNPLGDGTTSMWCGLRTAHLTPPRAVPFASCSRARHSSHRHHQRAGEAISSGIAVDAPSLNRAASSPRDPMPSLA